MVGCGNSIFSNDEWRLAVNINTPLGGKELWILHLTKDDDLIGYVKFNDKETMEKFKKAYHTLPAEEWGSIAISFDSEDK